jgi:hypothetical protein
LEETVSPENTNPEEELPTENQVSSRFTNLIGIVIIICAAAIAFVVYTTHRHDYLSAQADSWGKVFIQSSPVVEEQLGRVRVIKLINEEYLSGKTRGWYLDYDVSGRRGQGTIAMRMNSSQYDDWNIPSAELEKDHHKPINLR